MIIVLIIFVILSGFFSASETAFSSANEIRLKAKEQEGNKAATRALKIIDDYDAMLSTILIGNNIVNIGASAIATVLFVRAMGDIGATWSTIVMTVVILIFSEVTPKSIAKEMPEQFGMAVAPVLRALMVLFYPFNKLFGWWKSFIAKLFGVKATEEITEGEFLTMVEEAESGGGIEKEDSELIHSVLEFNDIEVADIFTPRVDVVAVSLRAQKEELAKVFREHEYSRIPVYDEDIDDIVGFLHQRDFYDQIYFGDRRLEDVITPAIFVAPSMKIAKALTLLQQKHTHMAVVSDGGTIMHATGADAQLIGGQCLGIGESLFERMIYDPNTGIPLNFNFVDYKFPTIEDFPDITPLPVEIFKGPQGEFGASGIGEGSPSCTPRAVNNAIYNAIGVRLPGTAISPKDILGALAKQ